MPDERSGAPPAIRLSGVSKVYRLYGSQRAQLLDALGLGRFGFGSQTPAKLFPALSDITLEVPKGHRIGIVGRNGAGKTTLLKLICGNFAPTSGTVEVNGTVQALLGMGLGFHPEFTGMENIRSSLQYNGLTHRDYDAAITDIVDFSELGEYIDQPFKTYSMGMQARLMFAAATAIRPDVLIIDEVLGAGDAYFIAKSKRRVERLVGDGATMLLVSHSTQQVLELCNEAIWLDYGRIRMQGEAFLVVKAYEEHMYGASGALKDRGTTRGNASESAQAASTASPRVQRIATNRVEGLLQAPPFLPHQASVDLPRAPLADARTFRFEARGGLSRWDSEPGIKVCGFSIHTEQGIGNVLLSMRPARIEFFLEAEADGEFACRYGIALHDFMGKCATRIFAPPDRFGIRRGELRRVGIVLNPVQLGPGQYTIGISVLDDTPLEKINAARRFDLLSRSFEVEVRLPESLAFLESAVLHTAEWSFECEPVTSDRP